MIQEQENVQFAGKAQDTQIDLEAESSWEHCGVLKNYWYVACTSEELQSTKPLGRTILGINIALFRDKEGLPRAVVDRCLHRNAALSEGVVIDGLLCCPYHGWSYDAQGRCVHVPSMGPSQKSLSLTVFSDCQNLCDSVEGIGALRAYPTREQQGLVYVLMCEDVKKARKEPFIIPFWNKSLWHSYIMITHFQNGVTNLVENFMDVPHTVFVHKGWFRNATQKHVPALVERFEEQVLVTYQQEQDRISGLGLILNPHKLPMKHTDHFIAPNITRVDYHFGASSGFMINSQCTPIGPTESRVFTVIAYKLPWGIVGRFIGWMMKPLMHWYTRQVIIQDTHIMNIQRRGFGKQQHLFFKSTEADVLHAYIESIRTWLCKHDTAKPLEKKSTPIQFWL